MVKLPAGAMVARLVRAFVLPDVPVKMLELAPSRRILAARVVTAPGTYSLQAFANSKLYVPGAARVVTAPGTYSLLLANACHVPPVRVLPNRLVTEEPVTTMVKPPLAVAVPLNVVVGLALPMVPLPVVLTTFTPEPITSGPALLETTSTVGSANWSGQANTIWPVPPRVWVPLPASVRNAVQPPTPAVPLSTT